MPAADPATTQSTIESLSALQSKLFAVPQSQVEAMSPEDRTKYSDTLNQTNLAISKLETASLQGVNDAFKAQEPALAAAAAKLKQDLADLNGTVQLINVASQALGTVTNIIKLLH